MASNNAFTPGKTIKVTAATANARTALPDGQTLIVEVQNAGSVTACIAVGDSTVTAVVPTGTASVNSYPILGGMSKLIALPVSATHVAYIRDGSSDTTLYFTTGYGA